MRRTIVIIIVLVIVVAAASFVGERWFTRRQAEPGPAALNEPAVSGGELVLTVHGTVVPAQWSRLSFSANGQLAEISVTAGITVHNGQVLARLDTHQLGLELQLAQSELRLQQASLAQLHVGPDGATLAAARASHQAAVVAYDKLLASPEAAEIALAEADLKAAQRAVQRAQAAYDAVRSLPDIGSRPESQQLEAATLAYQRQQASYELAVAGPDESQLKEAESRVASALAHLEGLLAGPETSQIQAAEASIERAQAAVERAQLNLEGATLIAPFDAVVTSVTPARLGEAVQAGTPILTVADLSQLRVETTDLDEWGAANLRLNQIVDLIIPALQGKSLRGRLTFLSLEPTLSDGGAVFYKGIVDLEKQDPTLLWGMSVRLKLYLPGADRVGFR